VSSFPAFSHYALTVSNLQRSIEWYERLFGSPPVGVIEQDNFRAANFESDSTTSPLVALVEKNSNPGQHDSTPWVSSMMRSWIDHRGPASHFGTRTTFSSSSFCRWVHRLPGSPVRRAGVRGANP
jgi:catechol 2,3-dioxygenase-like lactoylglutathione lyase family enzyme